MPKPKPTAKPVTAYVRVSSKDQRHDSQREAIAGWLQRNGIDPDKVE